MIYLRWFCCAENEYEKTLQYWQGIKEGGQTCPPESNRGCWIVVPVVMEFLK